MTGQVAETAWPRGWLVTGKEERHLKLAPPCTTWSLGEANYQGLFHRTLEVRRSGQAQGHSTRSGALDRWLRGSELCLLC